MPVGKRIYLKRELPNLNCLNSSEQSRPQMWRMGWNVRARIRAYVFKRQEQNQCRSCAYGQSRAGDNLALLCAEYCIKNDFIVVSNEGDNTRSLLGMVMLCYIHYKKSPALLLTVNKGY